MRELNKHTVEEWVVMYIDNELTQEEEAMLEVYIIEHPEYGNMFEEMSALKLSPEEATFAGKEFLKKEQLLSGISETHADELAIYEADNELNEVEKKWLSDYRKKSVTFDYSSLKLQVSENITYPNKSALKHQVKRTSTVWYRRVVAIAAVLIVGVFVFLRTDLPANEVQKVATNEVPTQKEQRVLIGEEPSQSTPITSNGESVVETVSGTTSRGFEKLDKMPVAAVQLPELEYAGLASLAISKVPNKKTTPDVAGAVNAKGNSQKTTANMLNTLTTKAFVLKFRNRNVVIPPIKKQPQTSQSN